MKRLKIFSIIIAGLALFSSCKKQLDLQPTDVFSDANAFLSINDIQLGTNEAYARYGNAYINGIYVSALLSDEAKLGIDNAGQGAITYRYQFNSDGTAGGDVIGAFGAYYTVIDQANRVLSFVPTVTATSIEEPRRNILKAQLLALRGISFFGLLQSYSKNYSPNEPGVPIVLQSDPLGKPGRNTMGEVMTQIEKDLSEAKALLPNETAVSFKDTVMNKINIAAYQARIALYKKDYQAAINYSTEVISSNINKPLVSGGAFLGIWTDANSEETLFRIRYATGTNLGALWTTTGGQYYISPSDKLVATYAPTDIRKTAYIGTSGGNNYVNKYYASSRGGRVLDLKASRIAEMYLIRAEAYAKNANPDIALGTADLNFLRSARIGGYVPEVFASATDLINAVLLERYKELAFEGFRFWDLKRNDLPVTRNPSDANTAWQTLDAANYRFILPIPRSEILLNPNMTQNNGY